MLGQTGSRADHVPKRSTLWLISFGVLQRHAPQTWPEERARLRRLYESHKTASLVGPDGRLPDIFESSDGRRSSPQAASASSTSSSRGLDVNNPLSLANDNPWQAHFDRMTSFEQIVKDVQRAFPDEQQCFLDNFDGDVTRFHRQLSAVLATWSLLEQNETIGYRQGMHEIAAVCWLAVKDDDIKDGAWIEADTFTMFEALMQRAAPFYVWRSSDTSSASLPILDRCAVVQESLAANDPALARTLESNRIAVQIFAVRWLRLLFLRELRVETAIELWDALFDVDASLHLLDHVCVALLIRLRTRLMSSTQTECLQTLMATHDQHVQPGQSIHTLIQEARQAHRRFTAVRSGYSRPLHGGEESNAGVWTNGYGNGGGGSTDMSVDGENSSSPPLFNNLQAAASFLASRGPTVGRGVSAQSLGAGFSRALDTVQRTAYAAYQAHINPRDANVDGFPPSMSSLPYNRRGDGRRRTSVTSHPSFARLSSTGTSSNTNATDFNVERTPSPAHPLTTSEPTTTKRAFADPLGADSTR